MSEPAQMPKVGEPAPDIDAPVTGGGHFSLAEQRGHFVAVYFFVRSNTPG
jgi:peroxiredoxin